MIDQRGHVPTKEEREMVAFDAAISEANRAIRRADQGSMRVAQISRDDLVILTGLATRQRAHVEKRLWVGS